MNKADFLNELEEKLSGLPEDAVSDRLYFYSEMIDDRIEDGLSEEEAVSEIGNTDDIVKEIIADTPISTLIKEKVKKKRLKGWELTLIIAGSPIWLSLLIAAFAVILSLYISVWSVVISLWSVFVSFIGCALGGLAFGVSSFADAGVWPGVASVGIAVVCVGFSIFSFYGCKAVTRGWIWLTNKMFIGIKRAFVKKERV